MRGVGWRSSDAGSLVRQKRHGPCNCASGLSLTHVVADKRKYVPAFCILRVLDMPPQRGVSVCRTLTKKRRLEHKCWRRAVLAVKHALQDIAVPVR
ncbi:hypothetical protein BAUCODRAFT_35469 [Baudoinia panamericana UAMH 10762]|uniref:Uncharacterized protein n=1 Tax=Baudoinia panamericana (strain UAMH 10762) TaxID=717646 RepID=M2N8T3_BAUPA|nr:uncharacterized protein BAUCODRAFT_35469 [Baudoinia panamericana UAMH 10762]EMC95489.1 hypothetical protein BAUCODRAFT_35469 [Baudoinia panamericana UAMH 10762]